MFFGRSIFLLGGIFFNKLDKNIMIEKYGGFKGNLIFDESLDYVIFKVFVFRKSLFRILWNILLDRRFKMGII